MKKTLGIRVEDKYKMERRVAITPQHLKEILSSNKYHAIVEPSPKRVFTDKQFRKAGATLSSDLSACDVVFGVKEMPAEFFEKNKTYVFFSHVIKGQPYNMPMLKAMMEKGCNLIDYEKIAEESGRRLIFFGRFAGLAGMINSLWSLGQRWKAQHLSNPFEDLKQAHLYPSLEDASNAIRIAGLSLEKEGHPNHTGPLVIGFTGNGNVSKGAQEIANLLPGEFISPKELLDLHNHPWRSNQVYKVVFNEEDMVRPKGRMAPFILQEYYDFPEKYQSQFDQYLPHLTVLMNCMYWAPQYPRILTFEGLEKLWKNGHKNLTVVGDVTCDPNGSIQSTPKSTYIENPVYVFNPLNRMTTDGFKGEGILTMAVDILPSELPKESSEAFSEALEPFIDDILDADYNVPYDQLKLPYPIKHALILHNGELTPEYKYIEKFVNKHHKHKS